MEFTFEDLITLDEAAELLGVDKVTLLRAIKARELKAAEIGRGYRTRKQWVQEYFDRKTIEVGGSVDGNHAERLPASNS